MNYDFDMLVHWFSAIFLFAYSSLVILHLESVKKFVSVGQVETKGKGP